MSDDKKYTKERLQVLSELTARFQFAQKLGISYGGERDLYEVLGYPINLTFTDYWTQYKRQDLAKAVIDRPVKSTWKGDLVILEEKDDKTTPFEEQWIDLENELKLKSVFSRLDRLTCIGEYGILFLGFDDAKSLQDLKKPVDGAKRKLLYVKPISSQVCPIVKYVESPTDPRFGKPLYYEITVKTADGGQSSAVQVHYSRVIHAVNDPLEDEVKGTPVLESVYNRLKDMEKLTGGSAEIYWREARPGYQGKIDADYTLTPDAEDDLKAQIDEYEHNLRRILINEGVSMERLGQMNFADPKSAADLQIEMISAATGIPKRILTGSERGELASTQDQEQWNSIVQTRREEYAEPQIIRPFIELCIKYGILPEPVTGSWFVDWMDLFSVSDKDKVEVGKIRATALKEYASQPTAEAIIPPKAFFEFFLGLSQEQISMIEQMQLAQMDEEDLDFEESEVTELNETEIE